MILSVFSHSCGFQHQKYQMKTIICCMFFCLSPFLLLFAYFSVYCLLICSLSPFSRKKKRKIRQQPQPHTLGIGFRLKMRTNELWYYSSSSHRPFAKFQAYAFIFEMAYIHIGTHDIQRMKEKRIKIFTKAFHHILFI